MLALSRRFCDAVVSGRAGTSGEERRASLHRRWDPRERLDASRGRSAGGAHGWPFAAAGPGRLPEGYLEEEYFLEGDADAVRPGPRRRVRPTTGGGMSAEREPRPQFRTRFVARRPIDPARFSGTVVVHWNNVSLGFDYLGRLSDRAE